MLVLAFLVLDFAMFGALRGLDLVWLHLTPMKLWTFDPNLHLSIVETTFCLPLACLSFCIFVFFLVCLLAFLPFQLLVCSFIMLLNKFPATCYACHACHVYHAYMLYASFIYSLHLFPSIACLLVSCLWHCMYIHGVRTHGPKAWSPRREQKGWRYKHVDKSQVSMFSRFRGLAFPFWLCTL